jgi:hypothetical protein
MRWLGSEVGLGDRGADLVCARPDDHRRDVADQRPDDGRHRRDHAAEVGVGRARARASGRVHRDQRAGVRHRAAHRGRRRAGGSRGPQPRCPGPPHPDRPGPGSSRAAADSTARSGGRRQAGSSGRIAGFCGGGGGQAGRFAAGRSPAGGRSVGGCSAGGFAAGRSPASAFCGRCPANAFPGGSVNACSASCGCSAKACSAVPFSRTGAPPTARPSVPARASPGGPGRVRSRGRRLAPGRRGLEPRPG